MARLGLALPEIALLADDPQHLEGIEPALIMSHLIGRPNPRPVVRARAPLIQWREIAEGDGVGYNHAWRASRPSSVATVSVRYADGYLRSASNRARLRLDGAVLPLVGRVSMDINALAAQAGTNAFEILTSLGARCRRRYLTS